MPGPHRSMHNISNLRQQSAGEGGEQEEDYRSCRRRRRNVCHGRIYANRVFFLRLHMDMAHGVSQRIDGDQAEDGRGLEELDLGPGTWPRRSAETAQPRLSDQWEARLVRSLPGCCRAFPRGPSLRAMTQPSCLISQASFRCEPTGTTLTPNETMRRARFSIISSVRRHTVAGLIVKDLFRGFEFWLVDEGLESSLPDEAVLATRLYTLEGFAMTAGVLVPLDIELIEYAIADTEAG